MGMDFVRRSLNPLTEIARDSGQFWTESRNTAIADLLRNEAETGGIIVDGANANMGGASTMGRLLNVHDLAADLVADGAGMNKLTLPQDATDSADPELTVRHQDPRGLKVRAVYDCAGTADNNFRRGVSLFQSESSVLKIEKGCCTELRDQGVRVPERGVEVRLTAKIYDSSAAKKLESQDQGPQWWEKPNCLPGEKQPSSVHSGSLISSSNTDE